MATEKRFVYYEHKGADYILDTPNKSLDFIEMLGDCLEAEEIVDLLNELHDETHLPVLEADYIGIGVSCFLHRIHLTNQQSLLLLNNPLTFQ